MSAHESFETAVELLRLRRHHDQVSLQRDQLRERVGNYPNPVNTRQLAAVTAELAAVELQIAELEGT